MSMLSPANEYKRQQSTPDFDIESKQALVKATLECLTRSLTIVEVAQDRTTEAYRHHSSRALTAIYVLQSSLDFERGGDIATNLFQLYEYSRQQLLKHMRRDDTANVPQARRAMSEILDAWQQIA
ncbi:flagellar export chaperone FliS [Marivita sp.]|mgnify:FL=1|uniref:flagellar export chaperone FliS n=1 Tax=Marivita sp. TaxID=2003365 RepID=UPI0025C108B5|nr:flagellar protein FliS [Marivita sp.]